MALLREYGEWRLRQLVPAEVPAILARDIMLECFATVHAPHFAATKAHIGVECGPDTVLRSAKGCVRLVFKSVGGDFENPTRDTMLKVSDKLAEKSVRWGMPPEKVSEYNMQIKGIIERVPQLE